MTVGQIHGDALAGHLLGGRYRIDSLIGRGGMANVYRATDEVLHRGVAVKLFGDASGDGDHPARAAMEVRLLAALNHPSLVTLYDARVTPDEDAFLVMELVDGPTLRDRIADGPISRVDVAAMALDLAEALHAVHAEGMVHRDVKPSNVLLAPSLSPTREFRAKLADFGIAHLVDSARLTTPGTIMGTAAYLSPEQTRGVAPAPAGDVYSLGLVLLESFTRTRAFPGGMTESLVARVQRDPVIPGELGYAWKSLLTAMTSRTVDARPSALEVASAARDILRSEGTGPLLATDTMALATAPADANTKAMTALLPTPAGDTETVGLAVGVGNGVGRTGTDGHAADDSLEPRRSRRGAGTTPSRTLRRRRLVLAAAAGVVAIGLGAGVTSWATGGRPAVSAADTEAAGTPGFATTIVQVSTGVTSFVTERQAAAAAESSTESTTDAVPATDTDTDSDSGGTDTGTGSGETGADGGGSGDGSPEETSPDAPAPDQTAPDQTTPDQTTPGQPSPDESSPADPGATSPGGSAGNGNNGNGNGNGNGPGNNSGKGKGSGG